MPERCDPSGAVGWGFTQVTTTGIHTTLARVMPKLASTSGSRLGSARAFELVRPLCHEVGNLLAAIRLSGHVLGTDLAPGDRTGTAHDVENLAAQAGE